MTTGPHHCYSCQAPFFSLASLSQHWRWSKECQRKLREEWSRNRKNGKTGLVDKTQIVSTTLRRRVWKHAPAPSASVVLRIGVKGQRSPLPLHDALWCERNAE